MLWFTEGVPIATFITYPIKSLDNEWTDLSLHESHFLNNEPVFNSINSTQITVKKLVSNLLFNYAREMRICRNAVSAHHFTINYGELWTCPYWHALVVCIHGPVQSLLFLKGCGWLHLLNYYKLSNFCRRNSYSNGTVGDLCMHFRQVDGKCFGLVVRLI